MNQVEKQTEKIYEEFIFERQENDKISNERELSDASKISALTDEVSSLKFKIRELEATNKEKEFNELKTKFVATEGELTHAKQNLVNYIHSFNSLEEKVKSRLADQKSKFDFNDEILRLRLENQRLHEENASLMM
jgi:hypothetical protein